MTPSQRRKLDKVVAKSFIFDDCHKIFLCKDAKDEKYALTRGWERKDLRLFNKKLIEHLYDNSCFLKAIWWMNATRPPVIEQFD